jgi:hypothetical protein
VVPRGDRTVKAARARALARRYPQSAEVLSLVAAAYECIGDSHPVFEQTQALAAKLHAELHTQAPEPLRSALPDATAYFNQPNPLSPGSFFARLALEAWAAHAPLEAPLPKPNECPRCAHAPQLGVLRPAGNGDALFLACSLCRQEWPFPRTTCPECGETDSAKIHFHTAEGWPHVRVQTCLHCNTYLHLLLPELDLDMIPAIDELALLPLDVWALEQGFRKIWPNLAGI